ncbi:MAG: glycine/sarcosine/betaine reductase component B subunit [Candidatus Tectimicrobiota bacterium]
MRLTLAYHPVTNILFSTTTRLQGTILEVSQEALRQHLLADRRLHSVELALVQPGEACRFGPVFDIVEPRAKAPEDGPDFPGIVDPIAMVGQGVTHVLQGAAVTVLDAAMPLAAGNLVEMSGEAGQACPYAALSHLVVVPQVMPGLERHRALQALRLASVKAAVYLGRTALGQEPMDREEFASQGPGEASRPGIPRLAYIGQIHSRQRVAEVDEPILYGANTTGMAPVLLHPNEWLDGALVISYHGRAVETYFYQNHPIITALYRWHRDRRIILVGTIATMAGSDNDDRARNAMLCAQQAQWVLGAEGIILSKYGGGAPHADMALTAKMCEELGMRTAVQVSDMSADRRAESALLFNYDEVDAIVYVGGNDTRWHIPALPRAIAGTPEAAAGLAAAQVLDASRLCGVTSQQGASHLRAFVH